MQRYLIIITLAISFILSAAHADQGEWRGGDRRGDRDKRGHFDRRERESDLDRRKRELERRERWEKRKDARERQEMLDRMDESIADTKRVLERMEREAQERKEVENMGRLAYFMDVTRRTGGEWLRVQLASPAFLNYVQLMPVTAPAKIHEVYLITSSRRRIAMNEFAGRTFPNFNAYPSDYIRAGEKIVAIDIRAESMGGSSNLFVTITSSNNAALPEVKGVRP